LFILSTAFTVFLRQYIYQVNKINNQIYSELSMIIGAILLIYTPFFWNLRELDYNICTLPIQKHHYHPAW